MQVHFVAKQMHVQPKPGPFLVLGSLYHSEDRPLHPYLMAQNLAIQHQLYH